MMDFNSFLRSLTGGAFVLVAVLTLVDLLGIATGRDSILR
jgi:hypothetical protein